MNSRLAILIALLAVLAAPAAATPAGIFNVAGRPAKRAVAMAEDTAPPDRTPDSLMLRRLAGVIDELTGRDLAVLRRAVVEQTRVPDDVEIIERLATLHLIGRHASARVEIARVEHGWILARSLDSPLSARLDEGAVRTLFERWPRPRPPVPVEPIEPGVPTDLPGPYTPSPILLDETTVSERFSRGGKPLFPEPLTLGLVDERFIARRPSGHDADHPAGLLVWISPTNDGGLPEALAPSADELGLICITPANAGNERLAVDRIQLTLDAVSTASARWWIDPDRVYAAGMSGGGRIASMLWSCFPDVFKGGVGVVGMNSHHRVGVGDGRYWPRSHQRPAGPLGRSIEGHRFAAVSGPRDFNFKEIRGRARLLRRDGLDVRVFDFADHLHAMSSPDQFKRAIEWVHRPWLDRHAESTEQAEKLMALYRDRHGDTPPPDERAKRLLERVTVVGPWTEPAWHAAGLLGYTSVATPDTSP